MADFCMFDLTGRPLNAKAYDDRPFTFLDEPAHNDLANINAINLIENGDRIARENWQNRRLTQLPAVIRPLVALSPLWHAVELARDATTGQWDPVPQAFHIAVLCAFIAVGWRWGVRTFSQRLTP